MINGNILGDYWERMRQREVHRSKANRPIRLVQHGATISEIAELLTVFVFIITVHIFIFIFYIFDVLMYEFHNKYINCFAFVLCVAYYYFVTVLPALLRRFCHRLRHRLMSWLNVLPPVQGSVINFSKYVIKLSRDLFTENDIQCSEPRVGRRPVGDTWIAPSERATPNPSRYIMYYTSRSPCAERSICSRVNSVACRAAAPEIYKSVGDAEPERV